MSRSLTEISDSKEHEVQARDDAGWNVVRIRMWIVSAFVLLFIASLLIIAPQIQQRLDRQTKNRLAQAGIDTTTLEFDWDYRNLTVSGYLPEGMTADRLASIMRGSTELSSVLFARGIRHLRLDLDKGLPIASSVTEESLLVEVSTNGADATLSGVVQNKGQRNTLVQAMLSSGVDNVFDNLEVQLIPETIATNQRVNAVAGLLEHLGPTQTRRSEVALSDNELYYRVSARDKNSALVIERAASFEIADFTVKGGVELLSGNKLNLVSVSDGEKISLNGTIYSDAQRKTLMFAASEAVGSQNVTDNLQIAETLSDSPDLMESVESMAAVVSRFAPGITGEVILRNDELTINAETGTESVRDYLASSTARAYRTGLSVVDNIAVLRADDDAKSLQLELDQLMEEVRQNVVFASGDSVLSAVAMKTLDKVALKINTYTSGLVVEIEGHTDDVGRASVNEKLSQNRAAAVRNYLLASVAPVTQLIAVGYGHRRPIESNDTPEGRQANRRVHFTVLKQPDDQSG